MEVRGKFNFPSQTFSFTPLNSLNDEIIFDELNGVLDIDEHVVTKITIKVTAISPVTITITIDYDGFPSSVTTTNLSNINQDLDQLLFGGDITGLGRIYSNVALHDLEDVIDNTVNVIFLYKMNSPKNKLDKSLTWVATEYMKYTRQIEYKKMLIDIKRSASEDSFNYVYLTVLNRFYFVDSIALTNDMMNVSLIEDVLSTYKDLIRLQTAFVTRNENTYNLDMVDDLVTYDFDKSISTTALTDLISLFPTSTGYNALVTMKCVVVGVVG